MKVLSIQVSHTIRGNVRLCLFKNINNFLKRFPGEEDPPYQPTKLFRVERIKPIKGTPYWERDILKSLKIDGKVCIHDTVNVKINY